MNKKLKYYLLGILMVMQFSVLAQTYQAAYGTIVNQCSQTNITNNLTTFESLGMKRAGTTALANTLTWLKNQYTSYGYTASQMVEDSYSYGGNTCKNLVVTKTGTTYPNTYVIVCGHYDSIGGKGTNDNGSGVVSILEVARLLKNVNTAYSIKFINFSGEEDGLYGSQHYVDTYVTGASAITIRVLFNLDEVGGVAGLTNNSITCERDMNNSPSSNNAQSATFTNELMNCVSLYSPLTPVLSFAYASDYVPFQNNGNVITGFFETNETTHKHTATDLLIYMDPVYNYNVAKAAIGATLHFAQASTTLETASQNKFDVVVGPNPASNYVMIDKGNLAKYQYKIINSNGQIVQESNTEIEEQQYQINTSGLSSGLYMLIMESGDNHTTKKIMIQ